MKLVRENINFTRGIEPKAAMGTGVWKDMPQIGQKQDGSFDLHGITKTICQIYNLPIINYTPIDFQSNYVWDKGYQSQYLTMNLDAAKIFPKFLGPEYTDRIKRLITDDYVPPLKLGISSRQKYIIKTKSHEFDGNSTYLFVHATGYFIPTDFKKRTEIEDWIYDQHKDIILQEAIWHLRYKSPIELPKRFDDRFDKRYRTKIDVKDYIGKYGQKDLESLMKQNYMWTEAIKTWTINNGILEFIA